MTVRKTYSTNMTSMGPRSIRATISTGDVDMTGEIVTQAGADLSVYRRNPIVLFAHNPEHPIGTASNIRLAGGSLVADIEFAAAGVSKKADEICALVKSGVLKTLSIGFDPVEMQPMNPAQPRGPQRYLSWKLCEISIVSIPANPSAIITDKARPAASQARGAVTDAPRTQAECKARVAALKAKGERLGGKPGVGLAVDAHPVVQRAVAHQNALLLLQRESNPSQNDLMARAERLAKKVRPAGY